MTKWFEEMASHYQAMIAGSTQVGFTGKVFKALDELQTNFLEELSSHWVKQL